MKNSFYLSELAKIKKNEDKYEYLFDNNDFLEYDDIFNITKKLLPSKESIKLRYLLDIFNYFKYNNRYKEFELKLSETRKEIEKHNDRVFKEAKVNFKDICGKVEEKELDDQQIDAIVRKNKNQLVIAGAGSGKTTTIVGKVKYLLLTKEYTPDEILLLSFTNASAKEMKERVKKETSIDLDVMTFHKLGLEIIKNSSDKNYKIFDKELYQVVKKIMDKCIEKPVYLTKLSYFMSTARFNEKDEFDFKNESEYQEYLNTNKPTTLKNEIVKSYGELEIANYLFKNNIEYIYENEYKYETVNDEYQQYFPDFYLPEYDIYIEYFGIDRDKKVAPYFKGKNGLSASEAYNQSIEWKRKLHKQNNTIMIETYYYENKEGKLISNLENKLKKYNVKFEPKSNEEIWEAINKNNKGLLNETYNVFSTIINLIKSNNYTIEYLKEMPGIKDSIINMLTLELVAPIYKEYENVLKNNNMIDFNDMINMATEAINNSKYIHNYKYVIVDEYQDMSISRFKLLEAMRKQRKYKLFCVGDDWQSIYRFNGSDIDLITNFEKYWGNTYISYIETTYRFTSMMSILSGNFIMRNKKQYKKEINAKASNDFAIKFINGYNEYYCIEFLEEKLNLLEKNSTVYFLGRYSFDIEMIKNHNFTMNFNNEDGTIEITYLKRRDLKIKYLTIHKSKGLQADYVVILNNKNNGMGFPSKINDLPIVKLLLAGGLDDYPFSEERRLFYVALTRSRKQTILLTIDNNKSIFAKEIEKDYNHLMNSNTELKRNIYTCPECGGRLVQRSGNYGRFLGCSNYPNCKYKRKY